MATLPVGASVDDAKMAAGHDYLQWKEFYRLTLEEARALLDKNPDQTWTKLPYSEKCRITEKVNDTLATQRIPRVSSDVVHWRMTYAVRDTKKGATSASSTTQGSSSAASAARPYDPVRDI
ncbi:hypothetical protein BU26DRAFT_516211 [Trematosphaeria pertusa]|uniref:Uncharacterized protein n=1 Tax=Trematosphaeria pertusa TaxID=390896 RepID=A0A6A6ITT6_9PLEO|nr:uncharacterized protein BU26DRAFT_516211 [Trematosphaeria pertusa]KAF2253951.1 hypothetical protein BU26DRAFT_516211 [Trematosphaeria pertusa]